MIDHFLPVRFEPGRGLQEQLREALVSAILGGGFPACEPLPSCRKLADQLRVSRNTVNLVYESLLDSGYIVSQPRRGFFLHPAYAGGSPPTAHGQASEGSGDAVAEAGGTGALDWERRFKLRPGMTSGVFRPQDWARFPYPFVYGQPMRDLFPLKRWREASRKALRRESAPSWLHDRFDRDDDMLVEQLRTRVLPKRGIWAKPNEILVTLGSQNALYLIAALLMNRQTRVVMETPGFRDALSIFELHGADVQLHPMDEEGLVLTPQMAECDYVYLTPSHQVPTGIVMSVERRERLMEGIRRNDQIVIEDDYDAELNLDRDALPAIKAGGAGNRVIYLSSLSKPFSPGLRLGYLVADADLVDELRSLRRLMYRHPPLNNQRMMAEFLAQGYYDAHLRAFQAEHARRRDLLHGALARDLDACRHIGSPTASAFWLAAPGAIDTRKLAWAAARQGVVFEYGEQFFFESAAPTNFMRLGFNAIDAERIGRGVELLAHSLDRI
ncbi:aminotransferase-like domain-containing protein [Aureimonas pseudogalii]|uniref:GntR family transcriptional regulator/MocR family aminotransferase n=1 Tax=Aureimonas pseudogalii TaxID=1744844 RepID=A0A7W6H5Q2_9HYPH|nr:PLP-dependent aminotransferase family protein [Aureimonas pseudogalii]MBB3999054.1 GntR family transcriptional regulator/MocR family aminotransferase [Aureimonas pseudogalii]